MKKNILSFPVLPGIVFIWLTAMVLLPYDAYGQVNADSSSKPYSWFSAGIGGGSSGYSQISNSGIFSVRLIYNTKLDFWATPSESVLDFSLLYGYLAVIPEGFVTLSGGLSLVNGVKQGESIPSDGWLGKKYEKLSFTSVGFPLEGNIFWKFSPSIGLGITLFADINAEKSFYGIFFCLKYGHLTD